MKFLFVAITLGISSLAQAATLEVVNNSDHRTALGQFYGERASSPCKIGPGQCWSEINVKFHPLQGFEDIKGSKSLDLNTLDEHAILLKVENSGAYEVLKNCNNIGQDRFASIHALKGDTKLSEIRQKALCLDAAGGKLLIE